MHSIKIMHLSCFYRYLVRNAILKRYCYSYYHFISPYVLIASSRFISNASITLLPNLVMLQSTSYAHYMQKCHVKITKNDTFPLEKTPFLCHKESCFVTLLVRCFFFRIYHPSFKMPMFECSPHSILLLDH
mmetsp:Transcript_8955/g.12402  ORF Transcript_8955/g.12402 Transcript_8955/m.12402 type:complete len:131 (-) Transcript_8955:663-1055(-)